MRYSVIIPVYNAESTIHRCVDSLLDQKYDSVEIILINDGSKDQSGEICREYASKHDWIRYIGQPNAGVSAARNAGLDMAVGEYITFVDSDDYVLDGYFHTLDQADTDFAIFTSRTIRSSGVLDNQFTQNLKAAKTNVDIIYHVVADKLAGPVTKKFCRSIIEKNKIRFKPDLTIGEDFIFGLEYMLCCESSQVIDRPLYCVDETGTESITRAARYDLSQFIHMYRYAFDIAQNCNWPQEEKERLIQLLDYLYCRTAFARISYCLQEKEQAWIRSNSLITMFHKDYRQHIQPKNKVHRFMRWCIKHRVVPAFFAVGYAYIARQKIKRYSTGII